MFKRYKYRLYPTEAQKAELGQHFGNARWLYNYALELSEAHYKENGKRLNRYDIQRLLPQLKEEHEWLRVSVSQTLRAVLLNLENAYKGFFTKKTGFPKFKCKEGKQSFNIPQDTKVDFENGRVWIPKVYYLKARLHRNFEGIIKQSNVIKTPSGKYYISVLVKTPEEIPAKKPISESQAVGVDAGIKTLLVCSDGAFYENPKQYQKAEERLKRMSRWKSWKKKGSNNRRKWNKKVAKLHEKVANQRRDLWHKITSDLLGRYDTVCVEDLNIKGLIRNSNLSKSISDAGWGMFYELLDYKAEHRGRNVVTIGRFEPSSKTCSECGVVNNTLTLKDWFWVCENGHNLDRDLNAAINIKKIGLRTAGDAGINACGDGTIVPSSNQEAV